MYGYVVPNTDTVSPGDFAVYRAAYCGLCVAIKEEFGQLPRYSVSYDMTFFTLMAIEVAAPKLEFENIRCAGNPARKTVIKPCPFMSRIAAVSMILFWHKLVDDGLDSGKRRLARRFMKKHYEKARAMEPEADRTVSAGYERLRETERRKTASVDAAADCFAGILAGLIGLFRRPETGDGYAALAERLCYNLGKFVYICDAVDDTGEDAESGGYNPVLLSFPGYEKGKRREYLEKHADGLRFALESCIYRVTECFNRMGRTEVDGILRNVIYEGLHKKAEELLASEGKLPAPKVAVPAARRAAFRAEWKRLREESSRSESGEETAGNGKDGDPGAEDAPEESEKSE